MKNKIIYICIFAGIIIALLVGYFGIFLPKKVKIAKQQKQEQKAEQEKAINLSYNQVFNSKKESSNTPGYYNSEYNGKVVEWQAKISDYYTQITGIKFCVIDEDHKNVDISKSCDLFWAGSKDLMDADNLAINPSWDGQWVPYVLNYYKVPFDKDADYYNDIYTIKGTIKGLDSGTSNKSIPDIEIISINKFK